MSKNKVCEDFGFKAIGEIDSEYKFSIPAYQRGYRWDREETTTLLDDLNDYYTKKYNKESKEIYCLQPLCLKKHKDGSYGIS